jgi:hypothetical protein
MVTTRALILASGGIFFASPMNVTAQDTNNETNDFHPA